MMNRLWVLLGLSLLVSTVVNTAVVAQEPLPQQEAKTLQELDTSSVTSSESLTSQVEERTANSDYDLLFLPANSGGENDAATWKFFPETLSLVASDVNQTYQRQTMAPAYITQVEPVTPANEKLAVVLE